MKCATASFVVCELSYLKSIIYNYVLEVWLFIRRSVNVYHAIYRPLCYWLLVVWMRGMNLGLFELIWWVLVDRDWEECCVGEWIFVSLVINFSRFVGFLGFLCWFLFDWDCCYRPPLSGFVG